MRLVIEWILSILAAVIMLQTLFFKFSAAPESVYIFSEIGMEPVGRIGIAIGELIASILILLPAFRAFGALLSAGLMSGAVFFHLAILGISVHPPSMPEGDDGLLFAYSLIVLIASGVLLLLRYKDLLNLFLRLRQRS